MTPNIYYDYGICIINGKRNAERLVKMFKAEQMETVMYEHTERVDGCVMPSGRYGIVVKNPGMERNEYNMKCRRIFNQFNNK